MYLVINKDKSIPCLVRRKIGAIKRSRVKYQNGHNEAFTWLDFCKFIVRAYQVGNNLN